MTIQSERNSTTYSETSPLKLNKKDHDKLVQWADDHLEKMKNARSKIEREWYLNIAFYSGQHWVASIPTSSSASRTWRLEVPKAPYWRARPTVNKIRPIIRTELAKVTAQKPSASVVPASSDDQDLFAAQAGEQIWEAMYRRKKIPHILRRTMWWTVVTGTGYMKEHYDPNELDKDSGVMGDISINTITPFNIHIPDFKEPEIEDQPYVIHATTKSTDYVKSNYSKGLDGKDIKPNARAGNDILDEAFLKLVGVNNVNNDAVLCVEVWVKPGGIPQFPNGAMFTVVDGHIVEGMEGWPYQHNEYPFIKFEHIPSGGYYGTSVINDLRSLNKEYNRTRGQIIESKNRMAKPQLLAPHGSIDPAKMTTEPGQVILYKAGVGKPEPLPLQGLPGYVLQEQEVISRDMEDISGQHQIPASVRAATAISFLQEQDDTKLSSTISSVEEGMEKLGTHLLSHVVQFWTEERMVKTVGSDGAFDTIMLKTSDLRGNTDIRVEAGSALPTSKAAKQAFIMDLMKMGFIDPAKGLEVMEIGGVQKLYEQVQVDTRQAQRENLRLRAVTMEMIQSHIQPYIDQAMSGMPGDGPGGNIGPAGDSVSPIGQMPDPNMMGGQPNPSQIPGMPPDMPDPSMMGQQANPMMSAPANPLSPTGGPPVGGNSVDSQTGQPLQPPPVVPVNEWDNHPIHIETHNRFRKSQAFEQLPDYVKASFQDHVMHHQLAMLAASMGQNPSLPPGMNSPDPNVMPDPNSQAGQGVPPPGNVGVPPTPQEMAGGPQPQTGVPNG